MHVYTGDRVGSASKWAATTAGADVGPEGSADQTERRSEYEHLVPLHARYAVLPQGQADRERLRAELIAAYLPVARNIARKYGNRGENLDDVEQVVFVGLVLAVDRFEPGRGFDFLSFAVPTISGEVLRHFRDGGQRDSGPAEAAGASGEDLPGRGRVGTEQWPFGPAE